MVMVMVRIIETQIINFLVVPCIAFPHRQERRLHRLLLEERRSEPISLARRLVRRVFNLRSYHHSVATRHPLESHRIYFIIWHHWREVRITRPAA